MTEPDDTEHVAIEQRLRRALTARADRVEPTVADLDAIGSRADVVRRSLARRRVLLSAAAVIAVVVAIAGGLALADDDRDRTDLATDGSDGGADGSSTTPSSGVATIGSAPTSPMELAAAAAIWPLPTMSITYDDPAVAALAFAQAYVGLAGELCTRTPVIDGDVAYVDVVVADGQSEQPCAGASRSNDPPALRTTVTLVRTELTWVVVHADSNGFSASDTSGLVIPTTPIGPPEIQPRAASSPLTVSVNWAPDRDLAELPDGDRRVELRRLGSLEATNAGADVGNQPYADMLLEAAPGTVVLLVTDGVTAIARPIRIDDPAVTATIIWPTPTSLRFDDPAEAARVFANSYFSLEPPPFDSCSRTPVVEGNTATVGIVLDGVCGGGTSAAEPFGPTTTVSLVHTGVTWAVTGATSNRFTVSFGPAEMDRPPAAGLPVPVSAYVTPTTDLDRPVTLQLRRVELGGVIAEGFMPSGTEGERAQIPMGVRFEGRRVLVVQDGITASATLVVGDAPD